jgi:hypothetical protein
MAAFFMIAMTITSADLKTDDDWNALREAMEPQGIAIGSVRGVLDRARELGAISVIVEEEYLDQDFSAEFAAFYSRVFKRFPKLCRRFHFFSSEVTAILHEADPQKVSEGLSALSKGAKYLGYVVARPVQHAPLGRVVLAAPPSPANMKSDLLIRSGFTAHLLGATLHVVGTPFTQQDSRIGACAQAAIWMAARHFQSRYRGSVWASTVDITEAASKPMDHMLSLSLPAGSRGLTVEHMVRGLRTLGREPHLYHGKYDSTTKVTTWPNSIRPTAVVDRYVDSGIPVIIGLSPWAPGQEDFHAVLAVGHTIARLDPGKILPDRPTRAEYAKYLLVNDDQRGANLRMPLIDGDPLSETPYDQSKIVYLIVPLPGKVFTPAESAEAVAWDLLRSYQASLTALKTTFANQLGASVAAADEFAARLSANEVVARTYLTYGWRYKERLVRNSCAVQIKDAVFKQSFPRFVWVTEFGTRNSFDTLEESTVKVFSHVVVDATSNMLWEGRCVFHAPGFLWRWYHDPNAPFSDLVNSIIPIEGDSAYGMKIRGT